MASVVQIQKINLTLNLLIFLNVLLQATKYYLIYKNNTQKTWQQKFLKLSTISAICIDPIMIWFGLFGDFRTLFVILAYITLQILLILDLITSAALWKTTDLSNAQSTFKQPAFICMCGYLLYIAIRLFSIMTILI